MGVLDSVIDLTTHPRMENCLLVFGRNGRTKIANAHTNRLGIVADIMTVTGLEASP
jgi:hypothetical protein